MNIADVLRVVSSVPTPAHADDAAAPTLQGVLDVLDVGVLVLDDRGRTAVATEPFAAMFSVTVEELRAMTPDAFVRHVASLVDEPPQLVRDGKLFPAEGRSTVCEEFELVRPARTVVRWVARRVGAPGADVVVSCTDITAEVELAKRLETLAVQDQLTGLTNRRGGEAMLQREIARARRYGSVLSVVLFDVDHFKKVNDTHGHEAGDQVLVRVGRAIAGQLRDTDLVARWGGEEFLVVLVNTAEAPARVCAERIRLAVGHLAMPGVGSVTLSGGIAQHAGNESLVELVGRADVRLYEAKRGGRNRVV